MADTKMVEGGDGKFYRHVQKCRGCMSKTYYWICGEAQAPDAPRRRLTGVELLQCCLGLLLAATLLLMAWLIIGGN